MLCLGLFWVSPAVSSSSDDDGESDSALSPNSDSPLLGTFTQLQRTWWSYIIFMGLPTNPSECFLYPSTSPSRDRKPGVVWAWFGRGHHAEIVCRCAWKALHKIINMITNTVNPTNPTSSKPKVQTNHAQECPSKYWGHEHPSQTQG